MIKCFEHKNVDKVVKGKDSLTFYIDDVAVARVAGVKDFSIFDIDNIPVEIKEDE